MNAFDVRSKPIEADAEEPDASDEEQEDVDDVGVDNDLDEDEDFMTDDGEEHEVQHQACELRWKQSDAWKVEARTDPWKKMFGEAVWHAPERRDDVKSLDTGPEQECTFDVDPTRSATDLFFDALPVRFFKSIARQSLKYAKAQQRDGKSSRHLDFSWFTAANYIRVFAAVLMRGLTNARNDPSFFSGLKEGEFIRTGAESVIGLTLNQYQQLIRYMHLVDNKDAVPCTSQDFDKMFKVRPMITLLQDAFRRWVTPGKNNAVDEAPIPSRQHWMRTFNPSKPCKYFIEILMACDSNTRFCWSFFITESSKKVVLNRHRVGARRTRSKYVKVYTHLHTSLPTYFLVECMYTH